MIKKLFLLSVMTFNFTLFSQNLYPYLNDQSGGITQGYGAWGNYNYIRETPVDIQGKGTVTFYYPDINPATQKPVVFFISGWGQTYLTYDKYFKYLASLGYAVVNIYNTNPGNIQQSYQNSLDMIHWAVQQYGQWIDTTKVGLAGHSYGAGSTIWLGMHLFDAQQSNWGSQGKFIIMFAPWLSFLVTDTDLQNYPPGVKLLMIQSYDDYHANGNTYNTDPRALRAVYQLINIPNDEKDFITVYSDPDPAHQYTYQGNTYAYTANHYVVYTGKSDDYGNYQPFDALDVYSSNRLTHALIKYAFDNDQNAKNVCLGNNSAAQRDMWIMPDLEVTDYYVTTRPESDFEYRCSENTPGSWGDPSIWHLQNYCEDADGDGVIDALKIPEVIRQNFQIYPNPVQNFLTIRHTHNKKMQISIYGQDGKLLQKHQGSSVYILNTGTWQTGIYHLSITTRNQTFQAKIIKE